MMKLKSMALLVLTVFSTSVFSYGITIDEVKSTQKTWGEAIVEIGSVFSAGGDHVALAKKKILELYDYEKGTVLFKPTLAAKIPFRPTVEGALSYFVGGNERFPEDSGFAIKPWTKVRFENHNIITYGMKGIAMGHYFFTNLDGVETKVEYTLGFIKRGEDIKITIQDSSLPYNP